jgi:hypothetical protein
VGHAAPAAGIDLGAFGRLITLGQGSTIGGMGLSNQAMADLIKYLLAHYVAPATATAAATTPARPANEGAAAALDVATSVDELTPPLGGPLYVASLMPTHVLVGHGPVVTSLAAAALPSVPVADATQGTVATEEAAPPGMPLAHTADAAALYIGGEVAGQPQGPLSVHFEGTAEADTWYVPADQLGHTRPEGGVWRGRGAPTRPEHLPCAVATAAEEEIARARRAALDAAPHVPIWHHLGDGEPPVDVNEERAFTPWQRHWANFGEEAALDGGDLVLFPHLWMPPDLADALATSYRPSASRPPPVRGCLKGARASAAPPELPRWDTLGPASCGPAGVGGEDPWHQGNIHAGEADTCDASCAAAEQPVPAEAAETDTCDLSGDAARAAPAPGMWSSHLALRCQRMRFPRQLRPVSTWPGTISTREPLLPAAPALRLRALRWA